MTRGPQPPAVYWRRRAFVLGVVLALALIVVNVVRGPQRPAESGQATQVAGVPTADPNDETSDGTSDGTTVTTPDEGAAPTDSTANKKGKKGKKNKNKADDGSVESGGESPAPPPPAPVFLPPVGSCEDSDVTVRPVVSDAVAGRVVMIRLRLRTVENPSCTWRLSSNHLALKITASGDVADEVWASRECRRKIPKDSITVRRDVWTTYDLAWNSRMSDAGCPALTEFAEPGEYDVSAAALGGEPSVSSFVLAAPTG